MHQDGQSESSTEEDQKAYSPGLSGLVTEMIQATGGIGTQWILDLCNGIVKEGSIPEDWTSSVVLPVYKGKGVVWIDADGGVVDDRR